MSAGCGCGTVGTTVRGGALPLAFGIVGILVGQEAASPRGLAREALGPQRLGEPAARDADVLRAKREDPEGQPVRLDPVAKEEVVLDVVDDDDRARGKPGRDLREDPFPTRVALVGIVVKRE